MSTAGLAMLATIALVQLGTELFPVLEGRAGISICYTDLYCVCVCVCVHVYTCNYVYAQVYIYAHTHTFVRTLWLYRPLPPVQPTSNTPVSALVLPLCGAVAGLRGLENLKREYIYIYIKYICICIKHICIEIERERESR